MDIAIYQYNIQRLLLFMFCYNTILSHHSIDND